MFTDKELDELGNILLWAMGEGYTTIIKKDSVLETIIKKLPIHHKDLNYVKELSGLIFESKEFEDQA
jgi:hypothetical protein